MAHNKRWDSIDIETINANYHTKSINEIAQMIGRTRAAVYQKAQAMKLVKVPRKPKVDHEPVAEA